MLYLTAYQLVHRADLRSKCTFFTGIFKKNLVFSRPWNLYESRPTTHPCGRSSACQGRAGWRRPSRGASSSSPPSVTPTPSGASKASAISGCSGPSPPTVPPVTPGKAGRPPGRPPCGRQGSVATQPWASSPPAPPTAPTPSAYPPSGWRASTSPPRTAPSSTSAAQTSWTVHLFMI